MKKKKKKTKEKVPNMTKEPGTAFRKDSETFIAIDKYLTESLGFKLIKLYYAGTHSSNGLTPIVHYDCEAKLSGPALVTTKFRATVYWNNATEPPTITRMDGTVAWTMKLCGWTYVDGNTQRCNNEASDGEAMCTEHNQILDAIENVSEYSKKWENLVQRSNEIGRD
jgi:hypothetical protein